MEMLCANEININEYLDNIYIGIQPESNKEIAKRKTEFDDIEQYLYVKLDHTRSFRVPATMDADELWAVARENTVAETRIFCLGDMFPFMPQMEPKQYVVTTKDGFRGASAIFDTDAIRDKVGKGKFWMLPSSIHEVILVPFEQGEKETLDEMVREVNRTQVDESDRLGDRAYLIEI